jgi:hypothetical protein
MSQKYSRPQVLDPSVLRDITARYKKHNDKLEASFRAESASGMFKRLEEEDLRAAERRTRLERSYDIIQELSRGAIPVRTERLKEEELAVAERRAKLYGKKP